MNFLTFTPAERRALLLLALLLFTGLGVQVFQRYRPGAITGYRISFDSVAVQPETQAPDVAAARLESGIDPNLAPAEDLELLPGVGPGLAARIVADREAQGRYERAEDLLRVPGVGPRVLERMTPHLRFP